MNVPDFGFTFLESPFESDRKVGQCGTVLLLLLLQRLITTTATTATTTTTTATATATAAAAAAATAAAAAAAAATATCVAADRCCHSHFHPSATGHCRSLWTTTPLIAALAMQSSSRNCNIAPDLVLWKLVFPPVIFSGGVFFSRTPVSPSAASSAPAAPQVAFQQRAPPTIALQRCCAARAIAPRPKLLRQLLH